METTESSRPPRGFKRNLEVATNVAVLIAAVLVATYFVLLFIRSPSEAPIGGGPEPGVRLVAPEGHDFARYDQTLLLVLSTQCAHCEADVPLYRDLATATGRADCGHGLLALFPNDAEAVSAFQAAHDFWAPSVADVSLSSYGVTGTPTVMLVDRRGAVERVWVGELSPEREKEILDLVGPQAVCSGSPV